MAESNVVQLDSARRCVCGHRRDEHEFCNEYFPALCVPKLAPEATPTENDVCPCFEFETDDA